ncbi:EamA/RhaT family transporter [Pseudorhizobium endolithicum]|uniref:EamA/RhaT family transporter n=1 Tax=Pseudorhizobium endolithicum TaxID=1191678 RepID=A0ABM8PR61_9HYPH|nr:DMT family transporter [Pseudorhizobium endolithicum]CAD6420017.1 EamA/RhaT family transporter [Rhizobium sp. Q54]CAD7044048.1 EamA/RhaT family transporter [Pseudorhizobium endolithicum]
MTSRATGLAFALLAVTIFSIQDGVSKHLADNYPAVFIAMMRYWAFAAFALLLASRSRGGVIGTATSPRPALQIFRGVLLAVQIVVAITSFAVVGLAQSQAIFQSAPLIVALLSVPLLGERVGWRRWTAIAIGFLGVLLILKPETGGFDISLLLPIAGAVMYSLYSITTRLASRTDTANTSFFYTGVAGAAAISIIGPFYWSSFAGNDGWWMLLLCILGVVGHYLLIRAFDHIDAVIVQSMSYLQLVLVTLIGVFIYGETLGFNMVAGSLIVVCAGLFTIYREARSGRRTPRIDPPGEI